jgi:hypothetical protein
MLNRIKDIDTDRLPLVEAVELSAIGKVISNEFTERKVKAPTWLEPKLEALGREIEIQRRAQLDLRLRRIETAIHNLKPAEEQRQELEKEAEELKKDLAAV